MAETHRLIAAKDVGLRIKDLSGTLSKTVTTLHNSFVSIPLELLREKVAYSAQSGGDRALYGYSDNGVAAPMQMSFTVAAEDLTNTTDADYPLFWLLQQLHRGNLLSGLTTTCPLTSATEPMLDLEVTLYGAGAAGANQVLTAAFGVRELGETTEVNGHVGYPVNIDIVENWAKS